MERESNVTDFTDWKLANKRLSLRERMRAHIFREQVEGRMNPDEDVFLSPESIPGNVTSFPDLEPLRWEDE